MNKVFKTICFSRETKLIFVITDHEMVFKNLKRNLMDIGN